MLGGMNERQMKKMMQQMGIKSEEVPAEEVIIRMQDKELVISNPNVTKVSMGGKDTFQIVGDVSERTKEAFTDEDVKMIMDQTGKDEETVKKALKEEGDIAAAIMKLKGE